MYLPVLGCELQGGKSQNASFGLSYVRKRKIRLETGRNQANLEDKWIRECRNGTYGEIGSCPEEESREKEK